VLISEINSVLKFDGTMGIILGSGLGHVVNMLTNKRILPFKEIASFPLSKVEGHEGEFISGYIEGKQILVARGRLHYYEGINLKTVSLPIKVFHQLGIKNVIITNSSGSLKLKNHPGSIMLINGHFDSTFLSNSSLPKLKCGEIYYSQEMINIASSVAKKNDVKLLEGKYCWMLGPAYETPAEIQFLKDLGGDAVGMSTVPEIEYAKEHNIDVLVLSVLTNFAAGLVNKLLKHEDVLASAKKIENDFGRLIIKIINHIGRK
jgi:purine-nucleoside phosphorylase|tara:strand:+ start:873 stop:1655 length:783 start_codon:yes stop_codon:yes gene_type:complete